MKENIFELRKQIINELRSINDDVKISIKDLNPKFDDTIVQLILFDSGEEKNEGSYHRKIENFVDRERDYCRRGSPYGMRITLGTLINTFENNFYDFFYNELEFVINERELNKKPSDLYFEFRDLYMDEFGKKAHSKIFALPEDVLEKIDFTGVSFDDFKAYNYDFSNLYGVKINPQTIFERNLCKSKFKNVEFVGPFDNCKIFGSDFTGSKNAIIDPKKLYMNLTSYYEGERLKLNISGCNFNSVTFTNDIGKGDCEFVEMSGTKFAGSKNAIINEKKVYDFTDCDLEDADFHGNINSYYKRRNAFGEVVEYNRIIKDAKFRGMKRHGKYNRINICFFDKNFSNTDFYGCEIEGTIKSGNICGASFEGSKGAVIQLGNVEYDENTNFSDSVVYDKNGEKLNITVDGRISFNAKEILNEIFKQPSEEILSKKAEEDAITAALIEKRKEALKKIRDDLDVLCKIEASGLEVKDLYGKIIVYDDLFLVKQGDHYEINRNLLPYLRFLNLRFIDFTNVYVAGLDFKRTFARIDPQKVYNKDISNCTFDNYNLDYDADLTDVNYDGANFDECSDLFQQFHKNNLKLVR